MKKVDIKSLLIGAVLAVAVMFAVAATTGTGNKTVWEYGTLAQFVGNPTEKQRPDGRDGTMSFPL